MNEVQIDLKNQKKRYLSIDVFKGLSVVLMVFANTMAFYDNVPAWSKHAVPYGLTYVDVVAPFFIFMLALNFEISFNRRKKSDGRSKAYIRFIRRYIIFIIMGYSLTIDYVSGMIIFRWGTFQVLGTSGLVLLLFMELRPYYRLIAAIFLMIIHQILLYTSLSSVIYDGIEGGFFGVLSWISMMLLSSVISRGLLKGNIKVYFLYGGILCSVLGVIINFFWRISRPYISVSYVFVSAGIASIIFYFLYEIFEVWNSKFKFFNQDNFLSIIGKNAFMLFLLDFLVIFIIYVMIPTDVPFFLIFTMGVISIIVIWIIAFLMNKVEMYIII
jgi:predicted acyltransferase